MSVTTYLCVGALVAGYFAHGNHMRSGDWPKATGIVVISALWPVAIGLGLGLMLDSLFRALWGVAKLVLAKARGEA